MSTTLEVVPVDHSSAAPLYHKYPNQSSPQGAYLELDCQTGRLWATWNAEIGNAVPFSVFNGHERRYPLSAFITADALNDLLSDSEILVLIQRVLDGYSSKWDGSNMVACLTGDALKAEEDIERRLERIPDDESRLAAVWDVRDWLFTCGSLTEHWCDQPLAVAVAELEENSKDGNNVIDGDIEESLLEEAQRLFENGSDLTTASHVAELLCAGRITQEAADGWRAEQIDYSQNGWHPLVYCSALVLIENGLPVRVSDGGDPADPHRCDVRELERILASIFNRPCPIGTWSNAYGEPDATAPVKFTDSYEDQR